MKSSHCTALLKKTTDFRLKGDSIPMLFSDQHKIPDVEMQHTGLVDMKKTCWIPTARCSRNIEARCPCWKLWTSLWQEHDKVHRWKLKRTLSTPPRQWRFQLVAVLSFYDYFPKNRLTRRTYLQGKHRIPSLDADILLCINTAYVRYETPEFY
jgi:hypothetical protein